MLPITPDNQSQNAIIPDPWENGTVEPQIATSEYLAFVHQLETPEHPLMTPINPIGTPLIAAPHSTTATQALLQDELKVHGFAQTKLGQAIKALLALLWFAKT
jgi:hypothetical protein